MSTIDDILKRQAAAVTGSDKLKAAEHLEAAAKLLRQEAGQTQKVSFAIIKKANIDAREKRLAAFGDANIKRHQEKIDTALANGGFKHVQTFSETGEQVYCIPGKNGLRLSIKKGKFSVVAGGELICEPLPTDYLPAWVEKYKKQRKP